MRKRGAELLPHRTDCGQPVQHYDQKQFYEQAAGKGQSRRGQRKDTRMPKEQIWRHTRASGKNRPVNDQPGIQL